MGLFTVSEMSDINKVAKKSNCNFSTSTRKKPRSGSKETIDQMSQEVVKYFKDSDAILITTIEELHSYIDKCIESGYCAIDTETTGLDRQFDTIVGFSLYYPGGTECYIPNRHLQYIFDEPVKGQLSYEDSGNELQRLVDNAVKMVFANADYDIAMIYKDFKVDFCSNFFYDVILAWRCIKEDELKNGLKDLYAKYVMKDDIQSKKFTDFFSVELFPYCKPEIAKLYAANDAKITFELFQWQLPYVLPSSKLCKSYNYERIADLIWNVEFPMVKVCAMMHRNGIEFDLYTSDILKKRYHESYNQELENLQQTVQDLINDLDIPNNPKRPFKTGRDFNPTSPKHVSYLCYNLLELPDIEHGSTNKHILHGFNMPQTDAILNIRSLGVLINTFIDKLSELAEVSSDNRIHAQFRSVGAATGRMSSAEPNLQNIPSHAVDIRHMFRATTCSYFNIPISDENTIKVKYWDELPVGDKEYKEACQLTDSDSIYMDDDLLKIKDIKIEGPDVLILIKSS